MGLQEKETPKPPLAKKMKQAKLSFFSVSKTPSSEVNKKRKKSDSESDDIKVLKVLCSEKNNEINETNKESIILPIKANNDVSKENNSQTEAQKDDDCEIMEIDMCDNNEDKNNETKPVSQAESVLLSLPSSDGPEKEDEADSSPNMSVESSPEKVESSPEKVESSPEKEERDACSANVSALIDNDNSLISLSDIPLTPLKTPTSANKKPRKLTPKQVERQLENQRRKEEREREKEKEREERERKKLEEKESKRRQREEREALKEKERLEKLSKKQAEIDQKNEEKRAREEERRKKEEEKIQEKKKKEEERLQEKKKREEERLQKEEEKRRADEEAAKKKEKAAAAFASFFTPKRAGEAKKSEPAAEAAVAKQTFMPFQVKEGMRLAPIVRYQLTPEERENLDNRGVVVHKRRQLYLGQLRAGNIKPKTSGKTWSASDAREIIILEDEEYAGEAVVMPQRPPTRRSLRAKLLQFKENQRPAYWGTWRKKSPAVGPRRPFAMDTVQFDYEVDSDDEWEEEEPGESLHGSDDEKDKESEDEYEVDNKLFVPHGYLSDEEGGCDEKIPKEMMKEHLKMLEREFVAEMKQQTRQINPRVIGLFWLNNSSKTNQANRPVIEYMKQYEAVSSGCVYTSFALPMAPPTRTASGERTPKKGAKQRTVPEQAMPDYIRLLHCNVKSHKFLAREFVAYWEDRQNPGGRAAAAAENSPASSGRWSLISLANANKTLKDLASWIPCPDEGPMYGKLCWYVAKEVRKSYELDLPLINDWKYTLQQGQRGRPKEVKVEPADNQPCGSPKIMKGSITKFTKKLSEEERMKQNKRKSTTPLSSQPPCKIKPKPLPASPFSPTSAFGKSLSTTKEINITSPKTSSSLNVKGEVKVKEEVKSKTPSLTKITSFISPKPPSTDSVFKSPVPPSDSVFKSPIPPSTDSVFKSQAPVTARSPPAPSLGDKKGRRVSILVSVPVGQDIPSKEKPADNAFSEKPSPLIEKPSPPTAARAFQFSKANSEQDDDDCVMLE